MTRARGLGRGRRFVSPTEGHPAVLELFRLIETRGVTVKSVAAGAGLHAKTVLHWARSNGVKQKARSTPMVAALDDCLRVLGFRIAVVPLERGGK